MSEMLSMASGEVPSLLVPMESKPLLVPNAAVAEVVNATKIDLLEQDGSMPNWYLGQVEWRGNKLPLISLEVLNGESQANVTENSQVAIINSVCGKLSFYGLLVQGVPRIARVHNDEIRDEGGETKPADSNSRLSLS